MLLNVFCSSLATTGLRFYFAFCLTGASFYVHGYGYHSNTKTGNSHRVTVLMYALTHRCQEMEETGKSDDLEGNQLQYSRS